MTITTNTKTILADRITPVSLYLKIRDQFHHSFLLESADYHGNENAKSIICFQPLASFVVHGSSIKTQGLELNSEKTITQKNEVVNELQKFIRSFNIQSEAHSFNGIFGYTAYDAINYFETIALDDKKTKSDIPEMQYSFFKYIVEINHFNNQLTVVENLVDDEPSNIEMIVKLINNHTETQYSFAALHEETSNITDQEFKAMITQAKKHCQLGDVFQMVLSRQFSRSFKGDEFNVYRALRSVNPSPYLFYFDFGGFKLFGSSPESQLKVANGKATINPIAGTFKRTGNDQQDNELAKELSNDPKENAEHNMLVDLARNDLSKHGKNVTVKSYKEVHFYSHVIHLVSEVETEINQSQSIQIFADTFPAGTLSGAPKYKALKLINQYENQNRGFYGGAIGYFGFDGSVNHAITIRSFLSKENRLYCQAGAGVVIGSDEESELQEVNNKLSALKQALTLAEHI